MKSDFFGGLAPRVDESSVSFITAKRACRIN